MSPRTTPTTPKKQTVRSPSFPSINLEKAIERARTLYSKENRHAAQVAVVASHWGFNSPGGSQFQLALAALSKYGLTIASGRGKDREVRVSDCALRIILDESDEPAKRTQLIKGAALAPTIHAELWRKYGAELPSDGNIRTYLLLDRKFNEGSVDSCIANYKATIAYAGLGDSDISPEIEDDDDEEIPKKTPLVPLNIFKKKGDNMTEPFAFPLAEGVAYVQVPANMSKQSYDMLLGYLKAAEPGLVSEEQETTDEEPAAVEGD